MIPGPITIAKNNSAFPIPLSGSHLILANPSGAGQSSIAFTYDYTYAACQIRADYTGGLNFHVGSATQHCFWYYDGPAGAGTDRLIATLSQTNGLTFYEPGGTGRTCRLFVQDVAGTLKLFVEDSALASHAL